MFKPTYLYMKTHNKTGLKYFGKTVNRHPETYRGSGVRWLNHLNYHGNDVTTEIIGYFTDEYECRAAAIEFSLTNNIVESTSWANLEIENGTDGGFVGCVGDKNTQFGTMWITDGMHNRKQPKNEPLPTGWVKGRTVPSGWGENLSNKLKGRSHKELLGEHKAAELAERKRQRMLGNQFAVKDE